MEKRLFAISDAIRNSKKTRDQLMQFWNLFQKKFDNTIEIEVVKAMFHRIFSIFWPNIKKEAANDFIIEQIEYRLLIHNQGRCQLEIGDKKIDETLPTKNYIHNERDEQPFTRLPDRILTINLDMFINLLVDFYLIVAINPMVETATNFFDFIFCRITQVSNDEIRTKIQLTSMKKSNAEFNFIYLSVHTERDSELIERINNQELRAYMGSEPVTTLVKDTQSYLAEQAVSPTADKNIKKFIENEEVFFTFFAIDTGKVKILLNIGIYAKFLFEKLQLKDSEQWVVRDLIDREIYDDVNYVKRYENLDGNGKDPYFLNKIKQYKFEAELLNVRKRLYDGSYCFDLTDNSDIITKYNETYTVDENPTIEEAYIDPRVTTEYLSVAQDVPLHPNHHFDRLVNFAHKKDLNVLLVGKPFTKKTSIGKKLAVLLDIDFVNTDIIVEEFLSNYSEENNEESETKLVFSIAYEQMKQLKEGGVISNDFVVSKVVEKLKSIRKSGRSYLFEVSSNLFSYKDIERIVTFDETYGSAFSYILELKLLDNDVINRCSSYNEYLVNNDQDELVTIRFDDFELNEIGLKLKRSEYLNGEDDDRQLLVQSIPDELKDDVMGYKSPVDKERVKNNYKVVLDHRIEETITRYKKEVNQFVNDYIFHDNADYLPLDISSLTNIDIIGLLLSKLGRNRQVYPKLIEGISSFPDLLKYEKNEDEYNIINRWSFYREIDCVEFLERKRVVKGLPENSIEYYNFVFTFASEENRSLFFLNPKKYVKEAPLLIDQINVSVLSPKFEGLNDLLSKITAAYSFKVIEPISFAVDYFNKVEEEQAALNPKLTNNDNSELPDTTVIYFEKLGIPILNYKERLFTGEGISTKDVIRLLYQSIGGQLEIKLDEEYELDRLKELTEKNAKKKRAVKKKAKVITLQDLVPVEHNTILKIEYYERLLEEELEFDKTIIEEQLTALKETIIPIGLKGYVFVNLPFTTTDIDEFKIFGFDIDKVIYMYCEELSEDVNYITNTHHYLSLDEEMAQQAEILAQLDEKYRDEKLFKIPYTNSKDISYYSLKIRDVIDPFKKKLDGENTYRDSEYEEIDSREKVARYAFGDYCPVNLVNYGWFTKGTYALNVQIDNEVIFFSNENNKSKFEDQYEDYLEFATKRDFFKYVDDNRRLFLAGAVGSGVKTLTAYIKEKYGLSIISIKTILLKQKEDYIKSYVEEKTLRKPFEPDYQPADDENNDIIDSYDADAEENENVEKQMIEKMFLNHNNCVFLFDMYLDERQSKIFKLNVIDVLKEKGLLPDGLIWIKSSEKAALNRLINFDQLKSNYEIQLADLDNLKARLTNERRIEIFEAMTDEEKDDIGSPDHIEVDDKDLNLEEPLPYDELVEKEREKIIELRTQHLNIIEDIMANFDDLKIPVRNISTEAGLNKVKAKLSAIIDRIFVERKSAFGLGRLAFVADSEGEEMSVEYKIKKIIQSGAYKLSKYGLFNYLKPYEPVKTLDFNFINKNQIYFVSTKEELDSIKNNTNLVNRKEIFDLSFNNTLVYVLNEIYDPSLRTQIEDEFQTTVISLDTIYKTLVTDDLLAKHESFAMNDFNWFFSNIDYLEYVRLNEVQNLNTYDLKIAAIKQVIQSKAILTDEHKIDLLLIWLRTYKNQDKPIIIENFPENDIQRQLLHENGLIPDIVLDITNTEQYNRCYDKQVSEFRDSISNTNDLQHYYSINYDNVYTVNPVKSIEANIEIIRKLAASYKKNLRTVVNAESTGVAYSLNHIKCNRRYIEERLSDNKLLDMATLQTSRRYVVLPFYRACMYSYNSVLYLFCDQNVSKNILVPDQYNSITPKESLPTVDLLKLLCRLDTSISTPIEYQSNCPISLSMNRFDDGYRFFSLAFRSKTYNFKDFNSLKLFFETPSVYSFQRFDPTRLAQHLELKYKQRTQKEILIDEITFALNQVCRTKPKYFKTSIKETVLKLFALYMKSRAPYKNEIFRQKYVKALEAFVQDCLIVERLKADCANVDYWNREQKEAFLKESDRLLKDIAEMGANKTGYFDKFIN